MSWYHKTSISLLEVATFSISPAFTILHPNRYKLSSQLANAISYPFATFTKYWSAPNCTFSLLATILLTKRNIQHILEFDPSLIPLHCRLHNIGSSSNGLRYRIIAHEHLSCWNVIKVSNIAQLGDMCIVVHESMTQLHAILVWTPPCETMNACFSTSLIVLALCAFSWLLIFFFQ